MIVTLDATRRPTMPAALAPASPVDAQFDLEVCVLVGDRRRERVTAMEGRLLRRREDG